MSRVALIGLVPAILAAPAAAQTVDHSAHGAPAPAAQPASQTKPPADPHAGHTMAPAPTTTPQTGAAQPADPHAGHTMTAPAAQTPAASPANPHAGHVMTPAPATPAAQPADPHADHVMPAPAQTQPTAQQPPADPHAGHVMTPAPASQPRAQQPAAADPHAGHVMSPAPVQGTAQPAADPHAGHDMAAATGGAPALAAAQTPPPPAPADRLADRYFGTDAMNRARAQLAEEHGGTLYSKVMANILEYAPSDGGGYRWDVEGWYGGDINRVVVKTEGAGSDGDLEEAEVQALYSRAVGRYTDLQAGVRHDFEPTGRTYATIGVDALFPYWFEAEAAAFLSTEGHVLARLAGSYDWRLTQRLILQPQAEVTLAAQDDEETETGSGLSNAELGLRLRYEIRREFAPYVGVSYERSFGRTADFVRAHGEDVDETRFVVGLRAWF